MQNFSDDIELIYDAAAKIDLAAVVKKVYSAMYESFMIPGDLINKGMFGLSDTGIAEQAEHIKKAQQLLEEHRRGTDY